MIVNACFTKRYHKMMIATMKIKQGVVELHRPIHLVSVFGNNFLMFNIVYIYICNQL